MIANRSKDWSAGWRQAVQNGDEVIEWAQDQRSDGQRADEGDADQHNADGMSLIELQSLKQEQRIATRGERWAGRADVAILRGARTHVLRAPCKR